MYYIHYIIYYTILYLIIYIYTQTHTHTHTYYYILTYRVRVSEIFIFHTNYQGVLPVHVSTFCDVRKMKKSKVLIVLRRNLVSKLWQVINRFPKEHKHHISNLGVS